MFGLAYVKAGQIQAKPFLGLLARCQTLQVYQATYGLYFLEFLVLSLDEKIVIYVTVHATVTVSHVKTQ